MRRALALTLALAGCHAAPELSLDIRLPADRHLLTAVTRLDLTATRDGRTLAQSSFAGDVGFVSLRGVAHGPRTVVVLDGVSGAGDVVAHGQTCPVDFEASGQSATLYFAPTNFFAPTTGAPATTRSDPIALPLDDGTVLLSGGDDGAGAVASSELFSPASATFAPAAMALNVPRQRAEAAEVPGIGALVTGGLDASGALVADAEIFDFGTRQFVPLSNVLLDARVGHRAVTLPDGRVLVLGGQSASAPALATTVSIKLQPGGGTAIIAAGPPLTTPRREPAAVVALAAPGVPVVIGGYGSDGQPLATIEVLLPGDATTPAAFSAIASLRFARAEATATLLTDGSILVVGGAGDAAGTPRADAELYNPITRTTTVYPLAAARRRHTATLLPDGRVLIAGGLDDNGQPLTSVELFAPGIGFVSERPLGTPRAGHVAVPLCDGTVLVVGGAPGAELYTPPAA